MPVYNEAPTVAAVLQAVRENFDGVVIVVDDGSNDGTQVELAKHDDIVVVRLGKNQGYGCALRIGFDVAERLGVSRLVTMDCDGQHESAHIPQFLLALEQGYDIVSGSRYLAESGVSGIAPADRRAINAQITQMINSVTGWGLTDAFCGFKAYAMSALSKFTLIEPGYGMPLELWANAWNAGLTVTELAVERIYRDQSRSFGPVLDDPQQRLDYYLNVWDNALERSGHGS